MPIEPEAVTTVSRRPIVGADKPRTLAEYQANVAERFGHKHGMPGMLPSWEQLARRETLAMRKATGQQEARPAATYSSPDASIRTIRLREAFESRKKSRNVAIIEYLTADFRTSQDVATRFKVSLETAQEALRALKGDGRVITARTHRTAIWRAATAQALEAAE